MLTNTSSSFNARLPSGEAARRLADEAQGRADSARDVRDWQSAEAAYSTAVDACRRYDRSRAGALSVQRGHSLKEMLRFEDAELCYRDGMAFGARVDTIEHLTFVARRAGWSAEIYPSEIVAARYGATVPSRRLLTRWDARALLRLFLSESSLADAAILHRLRTSPTLDGLVTAIIRDSRFATSNPRLLNAAARGERTW